MALKKSDLYSSLWAGADELRGGMDASQYKDYVLTLLFVKFVSDKAKADPLSLVDVPEGGSFDDLVSFKGKPDIGDRVNKAIRKLADANETLIGVINIADFDDPTKLGDGKALVDRLSNLVSIFEGLDFSGSSAEGDDLLGDAYEYLMRHFATESGKSKGQFYTPAEVSRVMAQLIGISPTTPTSATVYDPTCGSGSLLLKVADAAPHGLTLYGQEKDNATWALAVMNMYLHGNETADLRHGDTLVDPKFRDGDVLHTFDYLVANPPFSVKAWTNGLENEYGRFEGYSRPPEKNGDFAFLLHMVKSLKSTGRGAVILPHGVLFRGNTEAAVRGELVRRGYITGIIGLPPNLFFGTGIAACIVVLDKNDARAREGIFMIDASRGFTKDGSKNRLRSRDMHQIIDVFTQQAEVPRYSRMVPIEEIAETKNDYNLNIPRYIDSSALEDVHDLGGHIQGGITNRDVDALQRYWDAFPSLRTDLFKPLRAGYCELKVARTAISSTITGSPEYAKFAATTAGAVKHWWYTHAGKLAGIDSDTRPRELSVDLGETLLQRFRPTPLIDEYGVFEQLMSYWHTTMHDDVALVMSDGWMGAARPRRSRILGYDKNKRPRYEEAHLIFGSGPGAHRWVMDLVPPDLVARRFFPEEVAAVAQLSDAVDVASAALDEYVEEHAVDEGLLTEAVTDDGRVTAKSAATRLRTARAEKADELELDALAQVVTLFTAEATAKSAHKEARLALDVATLEQYSDLSVDDIKGLVIDDKWGAHLLRGVEAELAASVRHLVDRTQVLGDRYSETLGEIDARVDELSRRVIAHLAEMGVTT